MMNHQNIHDKKLYKDANISHLNWTWSVQTIVTVSLKALSTLPFLCIFFCFLWLHHSPLLLLWKIQTLQTETKALLISNIPTIPHFRWYFDFKWSFPHVGGTVVLSASTLSLQCIFIILQNNSVAFLLGEWLVAE